MRHFSLLDYGTCLPERALRIPDNPVVGHDKKSSIMILVYVELTSIGGNASLIGMIIDSSPGNTPPYCSDSGWITRYSCFASFCFIKIPGRFQTFLMRKVTASICLTLAVLFRSAYRAELSPINSLFSNFQGGFICFSLWLGPTHRKHETKQ